MTGFELRLSGIGSDRAVNCATTENNSIFSPSIKRLLTM